MHISYFDDARIKERNLRNCEKRLTQYRARLSEADREFDVTVPEMSLYYPKAIELQEVISDAIKKSRSVKYVLLIGIGGQSLGVEAVHGLLDTGARKLRVLDDISISETHAVLSELFKEVKNPRQLAVCVSSKSGTTTEVLANASVVFDELTAKWGSEVYDRVYFIGTKGTDFLKLGKRLGATIVTMPEPIGGRFSISTAAGMLPLALLGHDVDEFMEGFLDASSPTLEAIVAESAARLSEYHKFKYPHYNFFAFESRLLKLGYWYRQLFSESLGKASNREGKPLTYAMVPAISTAVELHSTGQLYMSGIPDVYTDFVSFDDDATDIMIPKTTKIAKPLKGYSFQEVGAALYGGVIGAYQEKQLAYRATVFEDSLAYSVGQFMAMRMREVMYVAELLNLNAFDQPNVELYKQKTKEILFV
jgi:glucose-6-phosphate isomerase